MSPPILPAHPSAARLINHITFLSRDALTAKIPCGKPHTQLPQKIVRTLRSPLLAPSERDDRPAPKPGDPDFYNRVREYVFDHVEVEELTGVTTAVYTESM